MKYKPDWHQAAERLTALWNHQPLDRPCVSIRAWQAVADLMPVKTPVDLEAYWLDPDYRVPAAINSIKQTWWGGEALPGVLLLANWLNCLGGTPCFDANTIWFETVAVDFTKPSPFRHDPQNIWTKKYQKLFLALAREAGADDFCVSYGAGLPVNDLLSMLMGTEQFLMALIDEPDWMERAILDGARDNIALKKAHGEMIRSAGHQMRGITGWMPFWAPEPFHVFQSDVSCMLSPELFERFVIPELLLVAQANGPIWYHLDGGDARHHLPRLLSLPEVRVVQYTPAPCEPPNGIAHLEMYQQIQKAGKIVHIAVAQRDIQPLAEILDPSLLMLHTDCANSAEGEQLLSQMVRWTNKRRQ